jgi:hypothetical protein
MDIIPLYPKCVICGRASEPDYTLITGDPCCRVCNLRVKKAQIQKEIDEAREEAKKKKKEAVK